MATNLLSQFTSHQYCSMRRFGQVSTDLTERMPFPIAEESHRENVTLGTEVWCPKDNEIPPATSEQDENLDAVRVLFVMRKAATPHSEIGTPKKAPTDGSCGNLPVYLNWSEESDLTAAWHQYSDSCGLLPQVRSLSLPSKVEELCDKCFWRHQNLWRAALGESPLLKRIGIEAFYECALKEIRIPDGVEDIGKRCFYGCSELVSVRFGERSVLKRIGVESFSGSGLQEIRVPDNVEELCDKCFRG